MTIDNTHQVQPNTQPEGIGVEPAPPQGEPLSTDIPELLSPPQPEARIAQPGPLPSHPEKQPSIGKIVAAGAAGAALVAGGAFAIGGGSGARNESTPVAAEAPPSTDAQQTSPEAPVVIDEPEPVPQTTTTTPEVTNLPVETLDLAGPVSYRAIEQRGLEASRSGTNVPRASFAAPNDEMFFVPGIETGDSPETATAVFLNSLAARLATGRQEALVPVVTSYEGDPRLDVVTSDLDQLATSLMAGTDPESTQVLFGTTSETPATFSTVDISPTQRSVFVSNGQLFLQVVRDEEGHAWQEAPAAEDQIITAVRFNTLDLTLEETGTGYENVVGFSAELINARTGEQFYASSPQQPGE